MRDVLLLLSPRWKKFRNKLRNPGRDKLRFPFLMGLIVVLWLVIYVVFVKSLAYFTAEEMFGNIAAMKLLSMILLTFVFVVMISNVITSFSTFFLSEDLELIISGPIPGHHVYTARFIETMADSSWMVLVFGFPIFVAYGTVFSATWGFYALSFIGFLCLLVMATALGIFVVQALVRVFPVRRLRDLFVLVGILIFVGVYLLFRMVRPEEFLNPEGFASVTDYLSIMSEPASVWLPTTWMMLTLKPYITGFGYEEIPVFLGLLVLGAAMVYRLVGHVHEAGHVSGYSKAMESKGARLSKSRFIVVMGRVLSRFFEVPTVRLIVKETLLMARDWGRLSQLLLLLALIVVYLYNFSVLPSLDSPMLSFFFKNIIGFINIGLAGFVLSSLGVRFLFPAISSEGRAFWILKGSPVRLRKVLWVKFFFYLTPMLALGLFLVIMTNKILELGVFMSVISTITLGFLTTGLTSLSIGMGVIHADLKEVDPSRAFTGFGGLLTMIYGGLAVATVVLLEAFPVYRFLTAEFYSRNLGRLDYLIMGVCFALALAVALYLIIQPLRAGLNKIEQLEI